MTLTLTPLSGIPLIQPGNDLTSIILNALKINNLEIQDGDILVVAQKIVSKSENRYVNLLNVTPSAKALEISNITNKDPRLVELILLESNEILRNRPGSIIAENKCGFVCANSGIDHSNVAGDGTETGDWVLLLPENPDASAAILRKNLEKSTGKKIGVLIIDSHGRAWRLGTVGVTIGISGMPGLLDERGWKDLFGYTLKITTVGVADELAAGASLVMGQAAEGTPVVHVRGFQYPLREASLKELIREKEFDMFR